MKCAWRGPSRRVARRRRAAALRLAVRNDARRTRQREGRGGDQMPVFDAPVAAAIDRQCEGRLDAQRHAGRRRLDLDGVRAAEGQRDADHRNGVLDELMHAHRLDRSQMRLLIARRSRETRAVQVDVPPIVEQTVPMVRHRSGEGEVDVHDRAARKHLHAGHVGDAGSRRAGGGGRGGVVVRALGVLVRVARGRRRRRSDRHDRRERHRHGPCDRRLAHRDRKLREIRRRRPRDGGDGRGRSRPRCGGRRPGRRDLGGRRRRRNGRRRRRRRERGASRAGQGRALVRELVPRPRDHHQGDGRAVRERAARTELQGQVVG